MKLTFELHGYTITIDETEEGVVVSASQDDEVVEEFTLDLGEGGDDDFDDEGGEDMDMDNPDAQSQELPEGPEGQGIQGQEEEDFAQAQAGIGESKLESFSSFIKKRG